MYCEVMAAEDKLAATLYSLQSSEHLYAENILGEKTFIDFPHFCPDLFLKYRM